MSKIKLTGSSSGYVELDSAADAGNLTLQLPTAGTALLSNAGNIFSGITTFTGVNITDDITFNGASYNVVWDKSDNQLEFGANAKLSFGSLSDLQLFHDGNNSYIKEQGTGNLQIQSANTIELEKDDGDKLARFHPDGAVELYHANSKRFETSADGIILTPDSSGVLISSGGDTNWTTGAMNVVRMGSNQADIRLGSNYGVKIGISGNNDANEFQIQQDNSNNGYIRNEAASPIKFQTGGSSNRFEIANDGNCTINDGNLVIGTSGHGIDFSAASGSNAGATSSILNDYESGTFQPLLKRLNGSTESGYYNQGTREGFYTKIGTRVTITGRIHWSGGSTGSGSLILTHLPFTPKSSGTAIGANEVPLVVGYRSGLNYPRITGYLNYGNSRFMIQYVDASGSYGSFDISPSATNNSGHFYFTATYEAT